LFSVYHFTSARSKYRRPLYFNTNAFYQITFLIRAFVDFARTRTQIKRMLSDIKERKSPNQAFCSLLSISMHHFAELQLILLAQEGTQMWRLIDSRIY
jgi:hypothetical protein